MKTLMIIIGFILLIPIFIGETLVKCVWAIIYSIIRPIVKNSYHDYSMYTYAYKYKGEYWFTNWLFQLWED